MALHAAGLAFAFGGALTGCTDQARDVGMYRDLLELERADGSSASRSLDRADPGAPLSVAEAALLANASSEALSIRGEEIIQAFAERRRAVGLFLPTVDLLPSYIFRDRSNSAGGGEFSGGSSDPTLFDVTVATRVTLFDGLRNVNRLKTADAELENRRALLLDLRETVLLDVVRAYYAVLVAERSVDVLKRSLALQEERLRDIRGRQRAGVARPLDVFQTEAQAAGTRVALLDAQATVTTGRETLAFAVGAPVQEATLVDGFDVPQEIPTAEELRRLARFMRQDLVAAEAAARAARHDVDVAIGQYAPSVSLNFDWFVRRDTVPTDRDWAGLLIVNVPIFSAGRIEADVQDAWSRFRVTVLEWHRLDRLIRVEIANAETDLFASRARLAELEIQVRAAREAVRQADASYQVGLATNLERLIALDQELAAELDQALEIYRYRGLYAVLLRSAGILTPGVTGAAVAIPPELPAPESAFVVLPTS